MTDALVSNVHDTALIFEGGGMRAAYTSAVVTALVEHGIFLDWVGGISAGSSCTVNYLARDPWRARHSFTDFAADPNFGDLRTFLRGKGIFNAEYIYEQTSEPSQALPLDWETFRGNPAALRIGGFDCELGDTVYWGREDITEMRDLMVRVRASSTMPGLMPAVTIDGRVYVDGALGHTGGIALDAARADGYEKFLVVLTQPREFVKKPLTHLWALRRQFRAFPAVVEALRERHHRYNATREELFALERDGQAYVFAPTTMPISNGERNVAKLRAAYDLGMEQVRAEVPAMREFLGLS